VGLELQRRKNSDVFARGHRVLTERLSDHPSIRDGTRSHGLGERSAIMAAYRYVCERATYDNASVDLLSRPEDQFSRPRRWELVGVFAQDEVDLARAQLRLHGSAEPV